MAAKAKRGKGGRFAKRSTRSRAATTRKRKGSTVAQKTTRRRSPTRKPATRRRRTSSRKIGGFVDRQFLIGTGTVAAGFIGSQVITNRLPEQFRKTPGTLAASKIGLGLITVFIGPKVVGKPIAIGLGSGMAASGIVDAVGTLMGGGKLFGLGAMSDDPVMFELTGGDPYMLEGGLGGEMSDEEIEEALDA